MRTRVLVENIIASSNVEFLRWLVPTMVAVVVGIVACSTTIAQDADFKLQDEAQEAGKTVGDFPEEDVAIWKYMDGDIPDTPGQHKLLELTSDERKGQNTWLMWCGGNEAFWDYFANHSYGLSDFMRVLDSRDRGQRFVKYGLISEPGFKKADKPDKHGVWVDERVDPAEESDLNVYGLPSGIVGLRLFPNPKFTGEAIKKWDSERYYNADKKVIAKYLGDNPDLVRPYRVGMSCAFCHVGPHPLYPPEDPENPKWENLSSSIGAQYFKVRPIFGPLLDRDSYMYQLLEQSRPGTLDTSLIPTDGLNNPNTMNAIFHVGARLTRSTQTPREKQGPASLSIQTDSKPPDQGGLGLPADVDGARHVPHVLVDGSDSIGMSGALNRVFINIGTFHRYWVETQNPLIGGRPQKPFRIDNARKGSVYWRVTETRIGNMAKFFLKSATSMPLARAPGGSAYLKKADDNIVTRGRIVFAENCMSCHSSKQPQDGVVRTPQNHADWSRSEQYLNWARQEVMKGNLVNVQPGDFLHKNYLSVDERYGVDVIQTNATRAAATNATRGHVWDNFSSETYKASPAVTIKYTDPVDGQEKPFQIGPGGPGYYRVPTLVSIWSTGPYGHNNWIGTHNHDPSVKGRMECYVDGMRKLLLLEPREKIVPRTDAVCSLIINTAYAGDLLTGITGRRFISAMYPWLIPLLLLILGLGLVFWGRSSRKKGLRITGVVTVVLAIALGGLLFWVFRGQNDLVLGPFPKGMPVSLLANIDATKDRGDLLAAIKAVKRAVAKSEHEKDEAKALDLFMKEAAPALLKISKCPDLEADRGHYFAKDLSASDKEALIELMKYF